MPKFDLAGNPLPEPNAPAVRLDLAGNPLPAAPAGLSPRPLPPAAFPPPSPGYAPPAGGPAYAGRPSAPAESGSRKWIGLAAGGVAFVVAFLAVTLLIPKHATVPTSFTTFAAPDKSFACDAPGGWETTGMDKSQTTAGQDSTVGGVLFQSNSAKIDITTDTLATLVASDLMKGNGGDPQSLTGDRAGVLHKQWKVQVKATHKGYSETQIADFDGGMFGGHLAEWTANGNVLGLGGKLHGYRASLVGGDKTAEVVCQCLDSDWPALKPAFLRVIKSIRPGGFPAPDEADTPAPGAPSP